MVSVRIPQQEALPMFAQSGRVLAWFSCGGASACLSKIVTELYPNSEVLYCNTFAYEHPDNRRFLNDVSAWIGKEIKILSSPDYADIYDVFNKTGYLVGSDGARCSQELKRAVREAYQTVGDIHAFGFTSEETGRMRRLERDNPDLYIIWPLAQMTKQDCLNMLMQAGIELPAMYKLGYKNNNCIGCVKGGKGYWNKIRVDFPEAFERMAKQERKMNFHIDKEFFLDELDPAAGRYESEYVIECGPVCGLSNTGSSGRGEGMPEKYDPWLRELAEKFVKAPRR
jgi:hypothetical protein